MTPVFSIMAVLFSAVFAVSLAGTNRPWWEEQTNYRNFNFFLIPRSAESCLNVRTPDTLYIDPDTFVLTNNAIKNDKILEFPGCVDIAAQLDLYKRLPQNLITYVEWQWLQAPPSSGFNNLGCKNTQPNGCGGGGNKCYYCNACNELRVLNRNSKTNRRNHFFCPQDPGNYRYENTVCINEWGDLDKDNDGEPDFVKDPSYASYRRLLDSFGVSGFGTVQMQFMLIHNTTESQQRRLEARYDVIDRTYKSLSNAQLNEELLRLRRLGWRPTRQSADKSLEREELKQFKKDLEHRRMLQELRSTNQLACLEVQFDICDKRPDPSQLGGDASLICPRGN